MTEVLETPPKCGDSLDGWLCLGSTPELDEAATVLGQMDRGGFEGDAFEVERNAGPVGG